MIHFNSQPASGRGTNAFLEHPTNMHSTTSCITQGWLGGHSGGAATHNILRADQVTLVVKDAVEGFTRSPRR